MTDKILELTQKIYTEGVEKAKIDADKIIADAKREAAQIINSAHSEQTEIIEIAKKEAAEIEKNTNSEIKLAARQFISKLKQQVTTLVNTALVEPMVEGTFSDVEFVKKTIETLINNWNPQKPEDLDLKILLPEKDKKEFHDFFNSKAIDVLNKGVEIDFDSTIKNGFKIGPKDGSYILSFTEKDFENYFKGYFKERTRKLLFEPIE